MCLCCRLSREDSGSLMKVEPVSSQQVYQHMSSRWADVVTWSTARAVQPTGLPILPVLSTASTAGAIQPTGLPGLPVLYSLQVCQYFRCYTACRFARTAGAIQPTGLPGLPVLSTARTASMFSRLSDRWAG